MDKLKQLPSELEDLLVRFTAAADDVVFVGGEHELVEVIGVSRCALDPLVLVTIPRVRCPRPSVRPALRMERGGVCSRYTAKAEYATADSFPRLSQIAAGSLEAWCRAIAESLHPWYRGKLTGG